MVHVLLFTLKKCQFTESSAAASQIACFVCISQVSFQQVAQLSLSVSHLLIRLLMPPPSRPLSSAFQSDFVCAEEPFQCAVQSWRHSCLRQGNVIATGVLCVHQAAGMSIHPLAPFTGGPLAPRSLSNRTRQLVN